MIKYCAVFWDIQNADVPKGQTVDSIVDLIRSTVIKPYNLNEIFFFCVCDVHKLPSNVDHSLTNVDFQAYDGVSADIKIMDLMRKFVSSAGPDCIIILLSCDVGYYGTLSDLKKLYNVSIYLIRLADSPSHKLDQIADHIFILNDGVPKPVEPTGSPIQVVNKLNAQANGIIKNSAIIYDGAICIGFSTLENAEKAIEQIKGFRYKAVFLTAKLIIDSLLAEILKCIKPEVVMQTKSNKEVKQLTFIKVVHSNEAYQNQIFKFCIAYAAQSGSQCVLSMKSYHWIVFLFKSDAQKFLPKVKMIYDAVICRPWVDVESTRHESPYFVESCGEIYTNEAPSSVASLDARDQWNIFFRYTPDFSAPVQYYEPTKWSLLYNLFEKLYDLGAKKVLFDGNFYCAHFDSMSAYQDVFDRIRSRYLEPLEFVPISEICTEQEVKDSGAKKVIFDGNLYCAQFDSASFYQDAFEKIQSLYLEPLESVDASEAHKLKAAKKMIRYSGTPWCLNEQLDLSCLVIKIESQLHDHFMEMSKSILGNRECIFIKSISGEIWIGFPDEDTFSRNKMICQWLNLQTNFVLNLIYNSWHEALAAQHFLKKLTTAEVPYLQEFKEIGSIRKPQLACSKYSEYYIINDKRKVLEQIVQNKSLLDSISFTVQSTTDLGVLILDDEMIKKLQYLFVITTNSEFKFTSGMISIIKLNLVQMDCPACIEFQDKVWVGVEYLKKGNKVKTRIDQIKFKLLHEQDDDDFEVGVTMESIQESPPEVAEMLAITKKQLECRSADFVS
uniref:NYN domain-containing protein n=1 Tax=Tetranychus urticae TaxID=32264 RepID=T1KGG7_TETUR